ncbi:MAG: type II toxin-antitoxin system HipA family toxin [Cellvibrionaceae bacterium]|nr:type II toxin-antitoxin system HipA family toxin [Cellvibrionaceae bacterium]
MTPGRNNEIRVLKLTLHGQLVGYLAGFQNSKNVLVFADSYRDDPDRNTFSLITHPQFPPSKKVMMEPWRRHQRLHPTLSNLLPEGALRELIAQSLKAHVENEFNIFSYLGRDLPGALIAEPVEAAEVPQIVLNELGSNNIVIFDPVQKNGQKNKFSLAGVQMKFSMKENEGRYNFSSGGELDSWIVKTPSTQHKDVPLNEFTAMSLAALVGVEIPEIKLVELESLENLPPIKLPDENLAFAIKRFDRAIDRRVHTEDFAQVLVKYPSEKYNSANYENLAQIIYKFSGDGLADVQQFSRRLLVNILLANGDAHLKNWSLIYADRLTPRLAPAYDIVTTAVYMEGEQQYALNLGKTKNWYEVSLQNFQWWAERADVPWRAVKPHLADVMEKARVLWPDALETMPMNRGHKKQLREHWRKLHHDFRVV